MIFIDFAAAFDSVHRDSLWKLLAVDGIPPKLTRLIRSYYDGARCKVKVYNRESPPFAIDTGVRQGCVVSPCIFNCVID